MEHHSTNSTYAIGGDSVGASTVLSEAATENIGKYGRMRREYLQEYQPEFYNQLLLSGKGTFCHHRTTEGLLPACVSTCVTTSRMFGDLNDPDSDISKKLAAAGDKAKGLMEDRGMEPRVYYIGLDETLGAEQLSAVHKGGNVLRRREEGNA